MTTDELRARYRSRIVYAFAADDLDEPGPASAVVLIRHFPDPLPGRLLDASGTRVTSEWRSAFGERLVEFIRAAQRPARQHASPDAVAVVFDDRAEMSACAAADLASGDAARWWWRDFLRPWRAASSGQAIAGLLTREIRYVPAAFTVLQRRRALGSVLALLPPTAARTLLRAIVAEFRLPTELLYEAAFDEPQNERHEVPAALCASTRLLAAVATLVGEQARDIRRPGRAAALAASVASAWPPDASPAISGKSSNAVTGPQPAPQARALRFLSHATSSPPPSPGEPQPSAGLAVPPVSSGFSADSSLAGVFYLLNAFRALNLPDSLDPAVRPWALFELVARSLWRGPFSDCVWRVLALLDGREPGTMPVFGLGSDCVLRVNAPLVSPPAWYGVRVSASRTRIVHPEGFPLLDTPCHIRQARPGHFPLRKAPRLPAIVWLGTPDSHRLAAFVTPLVAWRLRRALGLAVRADLRDLRFLLRAAGRIEVTRTQIDVVLPMEQASLRLRRAGLDADPKWLPAFGRVVNFHFR